MALNKPKLEGQPRNISRLSFALILAIALLMVDSIIELSFVSSMVAWLHRRASLGFSVNYNGSRFLLAGKPEHFIVDQGHTSNGAAGTAFILIGLGGILALVLRHWSFNKPTVSGTAARFIYYFWVFLNIPAFLLTTGALAYVFAVTNAHKGQVIDVPLAARLDGSPYPVDYWTPQNWFTAVLQLDLTDAKDDIQNHLSVMRGWQYNLIPMFLIQLCVTVLALWECFTRRKRARVVEHSSGY
ncbi:hypothetical protein F4779DRAFT_611103 [Xylariaceae sp. FL0662B]|nr:hypothetical protein F4779DRAFT_611103 [Xylariaceae sp. FL0662B]